MRDDAIRSSYASGGYSMKEIGEYYGLHYSWISRIVGNKEQAKNKTLYNQRATVGINSVLGTLNSCSLWSVKAGSPTLVIF
ncbi:MAG: hypothetical protein ACI9KN_001428 [Gammaproteobacteria bacterium]